MSGAEHAPIRTCVVCSDKKSKFILLRLALTDERMVVVDYNQRMMGRGAYVCPECLPRLRFSNRVQKAFRNQAKGLAQKLLQ